MIRANKQAIISVSLGLIGILVSHATLAMEAGMNPEVLGPNKESFPHKRSLIEYPYASPKKPGSHYAVLTSLRTFDLSSSNLTDEEMVHVMGLIKEESGFKALNLSHNKLENIGAQMLFDNLPPTIKAIDLSHNKLTLSLGVGWIMDSLEKAAGLESLDLSYNLMPLRPIIGEAIGEALEKNPTLQTLKLRGMGLNDESLDSIVRGLRHNTKLTYLDISENPMEGVYPLPSLLHKNSSIKHIEAEDCGINKEDFLDILVALNENQTLEYFAFGKNPGVPDEELKLWTPKIEQDLGFKVDLEKHTLTRISSFKKPVPREYYVYHSKQDKPSTAEKI